MKTLLPTFPRKSPDIHIQPPLSVPVPPPSLPMRRDVLWPSVFFPPEEMALPITGEILPLHVAGFICTLIIMIDAPKVLN